MKNTFKKVLPVLIVAFVLVSVLAVTAFATDYSWVKPVTLLDMSQSGVTATGYSDIDGNSAWTQIASASTANTVAHKDASAYWGWNFNAYYNSSTKTMMVMPAWGGAVMSGRNNSAPVHVGESNISNTSGIDERFYTEKWAGANQYAYYAHSFQTWLNENGAKVEQIEFRPFNNQGGTGIIAEQFAAYVADDLVNLKTVKLTDGFSFRSAGNDASNYNKFFENKSMLTTVQYGTFASNGAFTTDCPANAVTLMEGAKTDSKYGISNVILKGCTSVTRVIIKTNTANYVGLRNNMFNGCTSLKFVKIDVPMTSAYLVGTDAFKGCTDVNVYVDDTTAATALAAVTGITLKANTAYDADIKEYFSKNAPIYAEGVLIKIANTGTASGDNVAIRFIFKWDAANTPAAGTPVKVGVVACTADYYAALGTGLEEEKLASLLADTNTAKVKKNDIAIYEDGELALVGKFLAEGTDTADGIYSYAYTLYGIPADHYDDEIYAATYIQWADGTYSVASNGYTDFTGTEKNTISLYDVTLGLFKRGLINSEKVADKYLWDVIKGYAGSNKWQLDYDKAAAGINVEYFYLPDNIDGGYVLAYRAIEKFADDGVTLKGATMPHNVEGGKDSSGTNHKTETAYQKFKDLYSETNAIVVDHGVTAVGGARTFGPAYSTTTYNTSVKTVVYPNNLNLSAGTYAFHMMVGLLNVVWCHTDADGNYVPHMSDVTWSAQCVQKEQLYDLRGFGTTLVSSTVGQFSWDQSGGVSYKPYTKMNVVVSTSNTAISAGTGNNKTIWKAD